MSVIEEIAAERARQISVEGWTPEHDDGHDFGQMSSAAACYAFWPWDEKWWKPGTPRRNLVKAGALIVAEIERLDRAAKAEAQTGTSANSGGEE
jgi:hypothetical protein